MSVVTLSQIQFAITSIYHFFFVPLTLGLSVLVAIMETIYLRTGQEVYLRMTKFWGKLFLINFAMGVVTGIVMEFQFGMNWSQYSRFVGDIFGAPLAIEALLAFFLELTFLGLVDLWLGQNFKTSARSSHLAGCGGVEYLCPVDPDRKFFHAGPGRLWDGKWSGGHDRFWCSGWQPVCVDAVPAYCPFRIFYGGFFRDGYQRLSPGTPAP